jgi:hypothetical protein
MMRTTCWATLLVVGIGTAAIAEEPVFRFSKKLELPPLKQEELIAATLDSDVFAATRDNLSDIRVLGDDSSETSYVLRKATTTKPQTSRQYWSAREPAVRPLEDGGLEIIVHLDKDDPQPDGIRLITPLRNFEQRVRVYSSADGKDWKPAGEEGVVFDYSQYMDARSDNISFPRGDDRYFRIVIDNVTQELQSQMMELTRRLQGSEEKDRAEKIVIERRPFRIDRVEFWHETVQDRWTGDRKTSYPLAGFRVENKPDLKQTIIYVELRREPLTSLKLVTGSHNFSRHARVEVEETQGVQKTWRTIGEATVSRLDFRNLKREELAISLPESRETAYRIVIDNRNSQPLEVTGVDAEGNVYVAVFMAAPEKQYRLAYGNGEVESPSYDTAAIAAALGADFRPTAADLGTQVEATVGATPSAFTFSRLVNDPRVLGGVAAVLVAALAWGLYRAGRRLNDLPPEGQ